ncbi:MAG: hypothetical protein PQJ60_15165 [Spirochaetales bacterium]|nr:hypothetical protein [Spirochaetales bacterium]
MNTTPITFERNDMEYTLIGGPEKTSRPLEPEGFSVLLLPRGGKPFRKELLSELFKLNCREIISVEVGDHSIKPDEFCPTASGVHVLRIKGEPTTGDIINIGVKEACGKFVFVLWSDMVLPSGKISSRVFEKIDERNHFCTVPVFTDDEKILPTCSAPLMNRQRNVEVVFHNNTEGGSHTLFPSDYCGIYQREKFMALGGFDGKIANPYWQLMDLGFRVALWGESIPFQEALKISYLGDIPSLDITTDRDYGHFFMKTQAIVVKNGMGRLPGYRLFSLLAHSRGSGAEVFREFSLIRSWVKQNRKRFKQDVITLLAEWNCP